MKIFSFIILCFLLVSCSASHTNKMSYAEAERVEWHDKAENGNAEAQFMLGEAYCCGNTGFFSTEEAVKWWCKASQNGYDRATKRLVSYDTERICKEIDKF